MLTTAGWTAERRCLILTVLVLVAASGVTGATITALTARGTTWNGVIVLRIAVSSQDGFGATERSQGCFRYPFH